MEPKFQKINVTGEQIFCSPVFTFKIFYDILYVYGIAATINFGRQLWTDSSFILHINRRAISLPQ